MRKTFFLLAFISVTSFFISCKKDPPPTLKECHTIPPEKVLSTLPKLGQKADIEWETSDGRGSSFNSSVTQERPVHISGSVKTHQYVINGSLSASGAYGSFVDESNPLIIMIINQDTSKNTITFFKISPILHGSKGQSAWNGGVPSTVGVLETSVGVEIMENSMPEPNGDPVAMCMKITLKK